MMRKTLMALGWAASTAPALAESGVTLYGHLDLGLMALSNTSGGTGYLPSAVNQGSSKQLKDGGLGASNWGLTGTEDLGDGLSAMFQLQGNLAADTGVTGGPNSSGTTSFWNQMAVVGLNGRFGKLRLGRQVSPMYWAMATTDARGARYFGSVLTGLVGLNSASGVFIGDNSNPAFGTIYNDNAIAYTTPTWYHVTVNLEFALGETASSFRANSQQTTTVVYDDGQLKLSALRYGGYGNNLAAATAVYTKLLGTAAAASAALTAAGLTPMTHTNRLSSIGALYTRGACTISAQWFAARNPSGIQALPVGSTSLTMWSLAGGWNITPLLNLSSGYYRITDHSHAGNFATQFAMGLDYYLSKRTIAYAEAATIANHGANMNLSPVYASAVAANQNVHALMIGLRHSF